MVIGLLTFFLKVNPDVPNHLGKGVANHDEEDAGQVEHHGLAAGFRLEPGCSRGLMKSALSLRDQFIFV
jgi:hypothetical protein